MKVGIFLEDDEDGFSSYGVSYRDNTGIITFVKNLPTREEAEIYQKMLETAFKLGKKDATKQFQYLVNEINREID